MNDQNVKKLAGLINQYVEEGPNGFASMAKSTYLILYLDIFFQEGCTYYESFQEQLHLYLNKDSLSSPLLQNFITIWNAWAFLTANRAL